MSDKYFITSWLYLSLFTIGSVSASSSTIAPELASAKIQQRLVTGKNSLVVTNNPYASRAANQILKAGGSACDAAISAAFVLGLTEPQSSGIGGGGYALSYNAKNKSLNAFDGRETAPLKANSKWFLAADGSPLKFESAMLSTHAVGVPGEVALFYKMHQKCGNLKWDKLLQPAINLASNGFNMSPRLYGLLLADADILKTDPAITAVYFESTGLVKPVGDIVKNPGYAASLKLIAKNPTNFYSGKLSRDIIHAVNRRAGQEIFTPRDFTNYQVLVKPSVCSNYRANYQICSVPPSSSGGVTVAELMNLYALSYDTQNVNDPQWPYYFLEASKLAFADRNQYLADPAFVKKQPVNGLLAAKYLHERAGLIGESALATPVIAGTPAGIDPLYAPDNSPKPHGTTSIAVVDKKGNAVSMTVTVEHQFGSHIFVDGFFLNNELTDFSFAPTAANGQPIANRVEAGKRPRSSIAPVMVFAKPHNQLLAVTGSPGGSQIICYVAKNLIQTLDMHQSPLEAVSSGNLCAPNTTAQLEQNIDWSFAESALSAHSESVNYVPPVSGVTTIFKTSAGWAGAADPRREGLAIGE